MKQVNTIIVDNRKIAACIYKMRIESRYLARNIKPGQFILIRCSDESTPLLRRPFSVHRILKNGIEILYEVVGKGTELLSGKKRGEYLDVIGPLGNGFNFNHPTIQPSNHPTILVAGGIGVAPLVALAEKLAYSGQRIPYSKNREIHVFIGAKTASHILCAENFKKIGCKIHITTEDNSKGSKGLITSALTSFLSAIRYPLSAKIFACGPYEMLKEVASMAKAERIPCEVSLEERMACGVGVCLGCPVKTHKKITSYELRALRQCSGLVPSLVEGRVTSYEYKMVCKDGPVFDAQDIVW